MMIVVVGGTGFLGRRIVGELVRSGHEVAVVGRDPSKVRKDPQLAGVEARFGDVTRSDTLAPALEGADTVVCAVQFPNHPIEVPRKGLTYDRYDRRGTMNLVDAARSVGVRRFIYVSGAGADPASGFSWYRAKGLAERAVKSSGLEHSIIRPSWAYGPGDRALNRFALTARLSPVVPIFGPEDLSIQPVFVDDIAAAVATMAQRDEAVGKIFEIGSEEIMTMRQVVQTMLDVMGKARKIVRIPTPLARVATLPLIVLPAPPLTPQGVTFATQDGLVDIQDTVDILGVKPTSLREALATYLS